MAQMNYAQAIEYLQDMEKNVSGVPATIRQEQGMPRVIPIAFPKGKSSVLNYLDSIYANMKLRVCICHLRFFQNVEDCILIGGHTIPKSKLAEYTGRLQDECGDATISFAEAIYRIAYWYAIDKGCSLLFVESDQEQEKLELQEITQVKRGARKQSFSYRGYQKLEIIAKGEVQIENAARAVELVERFAQHEEYAGKSQATREKAIRKGLAETVWKGSLYQAGTKPLCIQDMANDARSVEVLKTYLEQDQAGKPWILLVGMEKEKDWLAQARELCATAMMTITVTPPHMNRREVYSAYELAQELSNYTPAITAVDSMEEALELGSMLAGVEGVLVCFGTHTIPGEVSRILEGKIHRVSDTHGI